MEKGVGTLNTSHEMSAIIDAFESGVGFYTLSEAAFYAQMHPNTLRQWFFGKNSPRLRSPSLSLDGELLLSFSDFVEAVYVRKLRKEHGVSFATIRSAIETAKQLMSVEHPFAHPDFRTVIVGREINIIENDAPDRLIAISHYGGQLSNRQILNDFIADLEFEDSIAVKYIAYRTEHDRVVMSPRFNLGAPMMESSGYTAEVLWNAIKAEGGVEQAAQIYGVDKDTIVAASSYYGEMLRAA